MTDDRRCEVCGAASHALLYEINGCAVVRCRRCGLVFVNGWPDPEQLIGLYGEPYYEDPQAVGYGGYAEAENRKRHHNRSLLKQLEALTRPGDLLEIGCAYGFFLDEAAQRGWRVRGVEPSEHSARFARERLGLDVTTTTFAELPVEPESMDAIVLWDVIEHLTDPRRTIEAACVWLRPAGVIALSTGNVESFAARLHGRDWSLMTPPWHQFYFARPTLRRLLEGAGLDVVRIGGDGMVGVDPGSSHPKIRGRLATLLKHPSVTRVARRMGAGGIMFVFARKAPA